MYIVISTQKYVPRSTRTIGHFCYTTKPVFLYEMCNSIHIRSSSQIESQCQEES